MANTCHKRKGPAQDPSVYIKKLKLEPNHTLTVEDLGDIPQSPVLFQSYTVQLPSDSDSDDDNDTEDHLEDDTYHTQDPHSHPSALNPIENTASSQMYKVASPFSHLLHKKPTSLPLPVDTIITPENNPYALIPYIYRGIQPTPLEVTNITDLDYNADNNESNEEYDDDEDDDEDKDDDDDDIEPMDIE